MYSVGMVVIVFRMAAQVHRYGIRGLRSDDYVMLLTAVGPASLANVEGYLLTHPTVGLLYHPDCHHGRLGVPWRLEWSHGG